jgi:hypothetical protein
VYASDCIPTNTASKQSIHIGSLGIPVDYDGVSPGNSELINSPLPDLRVENIKIYRNDVFLPECTSFLVPGETKFDFFLSLR